MKRVNKPIMVFAVLIMLIGTACASAGDEQWNRTFGGTEYDMANSVQQTSDGGYILAGETESYGAGYSDIWLIKTYPDGTEQWNRTFGGIYYDAANSVQQTSDGGYILAGGTWSYGAGYSDFYLVKTDSNGIEEWNRTFGGGRRDWAQSVKQTSDGGYILTGTKCSYPAPWCDVWLVKTDPDGTEEWSNIFGSDWNDMVSSVQQTTDGGYIIAGAYNLFSSDYVSWLIKTYPNGTEEWNQKFGTPINAAFSIQQTTDSGYVFAGNPGFWFVKTDYTGGEMWKRVFGGTADDAATSVQQTSDGGYILTGTTSAFGAGLYDFWLVKTNSIGIEEWNKTYGGTEYEFAYSIQQTSDGGFILAGETDSYGAGDYDVWLVKVYEEAETSTPTHVRRKGTTIEGVMMEEANLIPELIQPTQPPLQLPLQPFQGTPLQSILNLDLIVIIISCILLQKYYKKLHVQYPVLIGLTVFVAITIITKFYILNWALGNPSDILRYGSLPIYCLAGFIIAPAEETEARVKKRKK